MNIVSEAYEGMRRQSRWFSRLLRSTESFGWSQILRGLSTAELRLSKVEMLIVELKWFVVADIVLYDT